jgi:hypothetical protein
MLECAKRFRLRDNRARHIKGHRVKDQFSGIGNMITILWRYKMKDIRVIIPEADIEMIHFIEKTLDEAFIHCGFTRTESAKNELNTELIYKQFGVCLTESQRNEEDFYQAMNDLRP